MYEARSCQVSQAPCNEILFSLSNHLRPHYDIRCTSPESCKGCDANEPSRELAVMCVLEDRQKFEEARMRDLWVRLSGRVKR